MAETKKSPALAPARGGGSSLLSPKYVLFFAVTFIGVALDQVSKWWINANLPEGRGEIQVIDGFLSIVHAENRGAAFSMFANFEYRMYLFAAFTVVALIVLFQMLRELPGDDRLQSLTLGLIASGAIGNAIDRVAKQSVTDFVRVYTESASLKPKLIEWFGTAEWPSFNVADAAIVVGLGIFMVHYLFLARDDDSVEVDPGKRLDDVAFDEDADPASGPGASVAEGSDPKPTDPKPTDPKPAGA